MLRLTSSAREALRWLAAAEPPSHRACMVLSPALLESPGFPATPFLPLPPSLAAFRLLCSRGNRRHAMEGCRTRGRRGCRRETQGHRGKTDDLGAGVQDLVFREARKSGCVQGATILEFSSRHAKRSIKKEGGHSQSYRAEDETRNRCAAAAAALSWVDGGSHTDRAQGCPPRPLGALSSVKFVEFRGFQACAKYTTNGTTQGVPGEMPRVCLTIDGAVFEPRRVGGLPAEHSHGEPSCCSTAACRRTGHRRLHG